MDEASLNEHASSELVERKDALARAIARRIYERAPDLLERYGEEGRQKCLQDMHFNLEHLASAVALGDHGVFVGYVHWLRDLLEARGVPASEVRQSLHLTIEILNERIGYERAAVATGMVREAIAALQAPCVP